MKWTDSQKTTTNLNTQEEIQYLNSVTDKIEFIINKLQTKNKTKKLQVDGFTGEFYSILLIL